MSAVEFQISFDDPPGGPSGRFTVEIRERGGEWVLWTRGEARGPDVIVPDSLALERWLGDACSRWLRPTWDCQYAFSEPAAVDAFLAFVGAERPRP
ncbi:MAG: hypothetical protein H6710_22445 [Myxococcales bacterium]|nr:hypothetical protein [Myxococcales bacterium]